MSKPPFTLKPNQARNEITLKSCAVFHGLLGLLESSVNVECLVKRKLKVKTSHEQPVCRPKLASSPLTQSELIVNLIRKTFTP